MRVEVQVKKGGSGFNRRENGRMVHYAGGEVVKGGVSQHVYQSFKDRFVLLSPEPPVGNTDRPHVPGTDDDRRLQEQRDAAEAERQRAADLERETAAANAEARRVQAERDQQASATGYDANGSPVTDPPAAAAEPGADAPKGAPIAETAPAIAQDPDPIADAIAQLATVGVNVDPELAKGWTAAELARVQAVVDRKGANLPKFIITAQVK